MLLATAACCSRGFPGSEILFGGAGGQLMAECGSPVSALPTSSVPAPTGARGHHPFGTVQGQSVANATEATASACPWPWGEGVTGVRGIVPAACSELERPVGLSSMEGVLALLGKGRAVTRDKGPLAPHMLRSLAATEEPGRGELGTRGAGSALVGKRVCWRNQLRAPAAEPRSMATLRGLIFLVTAWQPAVI